MVNFLTGFENDKADGTGTNFNFILSNGDRSKQIDDNYSTKYTHMMPEQTKIIRSVNIYSNAYIIGFSFFDKDHSLIWKIGVSGSWCSVTTVVLAEDEVIIGVVARLFTSCQSCYTDF